MQRELKARAPSMTGWEPAETDKYRGLLLSPGEHVSFAGTGRRRQEKKVTKGVRQEEEENILLGMLKKRCDGP